MCKKTNILLLSQDLLLLFIWACLLLVSFEFVLLRGLCWLQRKQTTARHIACVWNTFQSCIHCRTISSRIIFFSFFFFYSFICLNVFDLFCFGLFFIFLFVMFVRCFCFCFVVSVLFCVFFLRMLELY